jgi:Cu(I)-responsive transcriptional regulator
MRIGEVAKATGLKIDTIRFYEAEGLIVCDRRSDGNYRLYGQEQVGRLSFIKRSRDLGFTLEQVRALLALTDDPRGSCADVDTIVIAHLAEVDRKLAALQTLRKELAERLKCCVGPLTDECAVIGGLMHRQSNSGR